MSEKQKVADTKLQVSHTIDGKIPLPDSEVDDFESFFGGNTEDQSEEYLEKCKISARRAELMYLARQIKDGVSREEILEMSNIMNQNHVCCAGHADGECGYSVDLYEIGEKRIIVNQRYATNGWIYDGVNTLRLDSDEITPRKLHNAIDEYDGRFGCHTSKQTTEGFWYIENPDVRDFMCLIDINSLTHSNRLDELIKDHINPPGSFMYWDKPQYNWNLGVKNYLNRVGDSDGDP